MAGRRPGNSGTRDEILAVARKLFSERGYEGTTIRAIAGGAGVNPALVHHFFGSKEQVFIASVDFPVNPFEVLPQLVAGGPPEQFGRRLATLIVEVWSDEQRRAPLLALLRGAMTGEPAGRTLRAVLEKVLMPRLEQAFGTTREVAATAFAQIAGIMLARYVIGLEPLASAPPAEVVEVLAPIIQNAVDTGRSGS
ncbi:TetR family transcriptional regulator [Kineosporia sp. J2-2]|uniref:TetR family transcriptional regulator n=1 Tax=Kineosporia corallincola TaxID=2835133 RepID=A0ABS5TTD1_9ACTN|nr:TetR family transcriptional regulator [Kineosporia corallincola]MBT0774062.1 TetR family transcriptional regulator [Kineosporia corallincola]